MGSPKHLLPWLDGQPLYLDLLKRIKEAYEDTPLISMSIRSEQDAIPADQVDIIYDSKASEIAGRAVHDIGPAAGLLAAHAADTQAYWLIIACDYPLLPAVALRQLINEYEEPLTCFENVGGFPEPLLGKSCGIEDE